VASDGATSAGLPNSLAGATGEAAALVSWPGVVMLTGIPTVGMPVRGLAEAPTTASVGNGLADAPVSTGLNFH